MSGLQIAEDSPLRVYRFEWGKDPSGDGPYHSVIKRSDPASQRIYQNVLRSLSAAVERYELIEPMIVGCPLGRESSDRAEYYLVSWSESVLPPSTRSYMRTRAVLVPVEELIRCGIDCREIIARGRWQAPGWAADPGEGGIPEEIVPIPATVGADSFPGTSAQVLPTGPGSRVETIAKALGRDNAAAAVSVEVRSVGEALKVLWQSLEVLTLEQRLQASFAVGVPATDIVLPSRPRVTFLGMTSPRKTPVLPQNLPPEELARKLLEIIPEHPGLSELWREVLFLDAAELAVLTRTPDSDTGHEGDNILKRLRITLDLAGETEWRNAIPKSYPHRSVPPTTVQKTGSGRVSSESIGKLQNSVYSLMNHLESAMPRWMLTDIQRVWYYSVYWCSLDLLTRIQTLPADLDEITNSRNRLLAALRVGEYCIHHSNPAVMTRVEQWIKLLPTIEEERRNPWESASADRDWGTGIPSAGPSPSDSTLAMRAQGFLAGVVLACSIIGGVALFKAHEQGTVSQSGKIKSTTAAVSPQANANGH